MFTRWKIMPVHTTPKGEMKISKLDPSDMGVDPLGFMNGKTNWQNFFLREAEIFYCQLGMLTISGFAVQEYVL